MAANGVSLARSGRMRPRACVVRRRARAVFGVSKGIGRTRPHRVSESQPYLDWMEEFNRSQKGCVRGKCHQASQAMVAAFPELRLVAGLVYQELGWGGNQHWWCVAPDGSIVDPTADQFALIGRYEALDPGSMATKNRIPSGVCMWCGMPTYHGKSVCSDDCEALVIADLNAQ